MHHRHVICLWITKNRPSKAVTGTKEHAAKASNFGGGTVDLRGIGPRLNPCHGSVIPLYYRPLITGYYNKFLFLQS